MLTTTTAGLLRAILESPADDTLRLVYADALEESGEGERAELIRCQILVETWASTPSNRPGGTAADGGAAGAALARSQELLGGSPCRRCAWHAPILHWNDVRWKWSRGFVSLVECASFDWLQHGPAICAAQPVTEVWLVDGPALYGPIQNGPERGGYFYTRRDVGETLWPYFFGGSATEHMVTRGGFRSHQQADDALSSACVAFARHAAGLPPLGG